MSKDETDIREDDVREEHLKDVNTAAHWVYMFGVVLGGLAAMVVVMAILGGSSG